MGIAAGDFDRSGTLDLHITNFQNEAVCLYLNQGSYFQDRAAQYKLDQPSRSVLGFGSQPIDYDNDGRLDLVVTNGHIENSKTFSGEFRQPPQLFSNRGGSFELAAVVDPSGYWSSKHLGRALARLDFDQDGKNDFVVTHLGEDTALLLNQTPSDNHWLQLELVGVRSERDAVGARVTATVGRRQLTEWVIGGDGYLCRNEAAISFGLGDASAVDRITIEWPSGGEQTLVDVASDQRLVVIEGAADPFTLGQSM